MYVAVLAYSIASVMATVFDVSSEQLSNHNYSGMWKLTLLCGCIQFTGIQYRAQTYIHIHTYHASIIYVTIIHLLYNRVQTIQHFQHFIGPVPLWTFIQ